MIDKQVELERELQEGYKDITRLQLRAKSRQEAYMNLGLQDMPHWDRIMMELFLEVKAEMQSIKKDLDEMNGYLIPGPETVQD